jgi:beta-galactosidase
MLATVATTATAAGALLSSDNFFIGGTGAWLVAKGTSGVTDKTAVSGTTDAQLFSYDVPLADGAYAVTLGFLEPSSNTSPGHRVFNIATQQGKAAA